MQEVTSKSCSFLDPWHAYTSALNVCHIQSPRHSKSKLWGVFHPSSLLAQFSVSNVMWGVVRVAASATGFGKWKIQGSRPTMKEQVTRQINTSPPKDSEEELDPPDLSLLFSISFLLPSNSDVSWQEAAFCHQLHRTEDISGMTEDKRTAFVSEQKC